MKPTDFPMPLQIGGLFKALQQSGTDHGCRHEWPLRVESGLGVDSGQSRYSRGGLRGEESDFAMVDPAVPDLGIPLNRVDAALLKQSGTDHGCRHEWPLRVESGLGVDSGKSRYSRGGLKGAESDCTMVDPAVPDLGIPLNRVDAALLTFFIPSEGYSLSDTFRLRTQSLSWTRSR